MIYVRVLDRKLLRDLVRLWAQSLAIALVMACGVATLILSVGTYRSLYETRQAYYERYRFGDVFATAVRAPLSLVAEISRIDGVAAVEPTIDEYVILDIEGMREPATGEAISLPPGRLPSVNSLYLEEGRLPEPARSNEVAVNAKFAEAHGFSPGDTFGAIVSGSKMTFTIVGIVRSPAHIYALGLGDMMPDNRRFGIMWMPQALLASLYDLDGAFNAVSLRLSRGASSDAVIEQLDTLLKPYGGTGAYTRKDQISHAFLDSELTGLWAMAISIPPLFLLVSAFLINMILSRLIALEREQIGLLKALGYGRLEVAWHYVKLVLVIAFVGVAIGAGLGTWAGRGLTVLYSEFYSFPFLIFQSSWDLYLLAAVVSAGAAIAGALGSILQAFSLPAAVAMRPPSPPRYRQFMGGMFSNVRLFSQLTVMGLRHLMRHPVRSSLTAVGIAVAVSLPGVGLGTIDSIEGMIEAVFFQSDREDATLAFSSALGPGALAAVQNLPGVMRAEPYLSVPVRIHHGQYARQLAITGKAPGADLSRVLDENLMPVALPEKGIALSDRVAEILHVVPGDVIEVEVLTGKRRTADVVVTQVIKNYLGLTAYMDMEALARLTGTGPRLSGSYVSVDPLKLDALYDEVKNTPALGSVTLQMAALASFRDTMRENMTMQLTIYIGLAVIIAFGVVYNSARIQLSERARELATLRVLGFRRAEVANVLFIETAVIVLAAQPLGWLIGYGFGWLITRMLATDLFRVPFIIEADTFAISSLVVVGAAVVSAAIVRRRINRFDLIQVLKTRE